MLFKEDKVARAEHQAVRENAGWYRWTHDLVEVKGKDAEKFLDRLFVGAITRAGIGRTKYTTMLNEDGKIIDDTLMATCWTNTQIGRAVQPDAVWLGRGGPAPLAPEHQDQQYRPGRHLCMAVYRSEYDYVPGRNDECGRQSL